jgi:hypothetical protein
MRKGFLVAFGFLASSVVGTLTSSAVAADRADVQQCVAATERGQRARTSGKLREAREAFLACAAESCPSLIRKDCNQWSTEIAAALPTVVFGAHDKAGKDLFDVTVTMDGELLTTKLDGKSIAVDPGPHTFRFETAGMSAITEKVLVKEGERARVLNVTFDTNGAASSATHPTPSPSLTAPPPSSEIDRSSGHTPFPWIVVGIGVAGIATGIVVAATTPDRPANCAKSTHTCVRQPGQTTEQLDADQETAGRADSQPLLGWLILASGAGVVGLGLLWHFLEPSGDARAKARVTPWTTTNGAGLTLDSRF